jgi:osmotically inducible lipoprotein OsmB
MRKIVFVALACATLAACASQRQTAGTAVGAAAGAVVAGPVGLVAGGAIGALVTAPGRPGYCYRTDRYGNVLYSRRGRPLLARC